MTDPQDEPPVSMKRPIVPRTRKPPSAKVIVPVALVVCAGLAFALFAAFPRRPRPAVVQPVDSASTLQPPDSSLRDAAPAPARQP
jgi:hypothetical protein